jgi:hypothetical protein
LTGHGSVHQIVGIGALMGFLWWLAPAQLKYVRATTVGWAKVGETILAFPALSHWLSPVAALCGVGGRFSK